MRSSQKFRDAEAENRETQLAVHTELSGEEWLPAVAPGEEPKIDDRFIGDLVSVRRRDGQRMVVVHHTAIWNAVYRGHMEELRLIARHSRHRLQQTRGQVFRAAAEFYQNALVSYMGRWLSWPRAKFFASVLMILVTGVASVVEVWKLLQNTPTFGDSPFACGVLAALVGAVPYGIKVAIYANQTEAWRLRVRQGLGILVVVLFIAFAVLLAFVTGGLGAPVTDAAALTDASGSSTQSLLSIHLQWVQLLLEVSVGLACLCFADDLYNTYGSRWPVPDRVAWMYQQRWQRAEEAYRQEYARLGWSLGEEHRLREQRKAFVSSAVGAYLQKAEQAKRQEEGIRRQKSESTGKARRWFEALVNRFRRN